jgi:hypothetical protein
LWIPSEELSLFNEKIVGKINIITAFFGEKYKQSSNKELNAKLENIKE